MATALSEAPTDPIGAPIKRVEDPRLVTGAAKYLDDLKLPGMAHVAIVRSPHAHARIGAIRTERAAAAEDALELVEVDWEPLPAVVDAEEAVAEAAPQLHENAASNVVMDWHCGDAETTERALGEADVVVEQRLVNQRLIPTPIEPRGAAAEFEPGTGRYTVWMTSQAPHVMRLLMTAFVFGIPETRMRCISPQIGGAFGTKIFLYPEYVLMAALAEKVGRPVKWVETRSENYVATTHGRDHVTRLRVGAKQDGTIVALDADTLANLGGILSTIAPGIPTTLYGRMLSGAYRIPAI